MVEGVAKCLRVKGVNHFILRSLEQIMKTYCQDIISFQEFELNIEIEKTNEFEEMIRNIQQLCLYLHFNNLILDFKLQYVNYDRSKHHLIDGFSTSEDIQPARVVLPTPRVMGIKNAVLMVEDEENKEKVEQ